MPRCEMCGTWLGSESSEKYCQDDFEFVSQIEHDREKSELTVFLESLGLKQYHVTTNPKIIDKVGKKNSIDSVLAIEVLRHYLSEDDALFFSVVSSLNFEGKPLIEFFKSEYKMLYFKKLMINHMDASEIYDFTNEIIQSFLKNHEKNDFWGREIKEIIRTLQRLVDTNILDIDGLTKVFLTLLNANVEPWREIILDHLFTPGKRMTRILRPGSNIWKRRMRRMQVLCELFADEKSTDFRQNLEIQIVKSLEERPCTISINKYSTDRIFLSKEVTSICEEELRTNPDMKRKEILVRFLTCFGDEPDTNIVYELFRQYPSNLNFIENLILLEPSKYLNKIFEIHLQSKNSKFRRDLQRLFSKCNHNIIQSHIELCISDYCRESHTDLKFWLEFYVGMSHCKSFHNSEILFLESCKKLIGNKKYTTKLIQKAINFVDKRSYTPQDFLIEPDEGKQGWGARY